MFPRDAALPSEGEREPEGHLEDFSVQDPQREYVDDPTGQLPSHVQDMLSEFQAIKPRDDVESLEEDQSSNG